MVCLCICCVPNICLVFLKSPPIFESHASLAASALVVPFPLPEMSKALAVVHGDVSLLECASFALSCADKYEDLAEANATLLPAYYAILDPGDIDVVWDMPRPARRLRFLAILAALHAVAAIATRSALEAALVPAFWPRLWAWIYFFHARSDSSIDIMSSAPPFIENTFSCGLRSTIFAGLIRD
ncbi:hypothetical protein K438DRAFT_1984415 [Mycena galopus ATCC 62051]|nr:hypothetical protein K438DRAFT_1984415 [Mycena galopus ATCC 62051]